SGEVRALAFLPSQKGKPPMLASAGIDYEGGRVGALRLWDVKEQKLVAEWGRKAAEAMVKRLGQGDADKVKMLERRLLLPTTHDPFLAAWHTGPGLKEVRVLVSWEPVNAADGRAQKGLMRLWQPAADGDFVIQGWGDGDYYLRTATLVSAGRGGDSV